MPKSTASYLRDYMPNIVITSFLPDDSRRKKRLEMHLRQRQELQQCFGKDLYVASYCSNYTNKEAKKLDRFECRFFKEPMKKWQKHNVVLKALYKWPRLAAVLFLDDDVVPRSTKEGDVENGLVNTVELVKHWIRNPDQMCGQLAWFACSGSMSDAYYKGNPIIVGEAPTYVTGWAMMVRSDLNVLYTEDLVQDPKHPKYMLDDFPFRVKCGAEGKTVIKHYRAFFKSFQSKDKAEIDSAWFHNQEHRKATNRHQAERMREMFPAFFRRGKKAKSAPKGFGLI